MATEDTSNAESASTDEGAGSGASTKQTAARKSTRKSTARSSAKKSSGTKSAASPRPAERSSSGAPRASAGKKRTASSIASGAARQLLELTGREAEGVTGLERTDDGWKVAVEVLEVRRIPETTDVLALYEVEVDSGGDLVGYHRVRRYNRGAPGEG